MRTKTILGVIASVLLIVVAVIAQEAASDDPPTILHYGGGALPNDESLGQGQATIPPGASLNDAVRIGTAPDLFNHIHWKSGPQACVFTARDRPLGSHARLQDVGGGRTLDADAGQHTAYISEGYSVYGVSGGSCARFGVQECTGPFCR